MSDSEIQHPKTPRSREWASWAIAALLVGYIFVHMSQAKFRTLTGSPNFDPRDDTGLFWTENAFHYRYAKLAASGAGIPEVDRRMQHPEGMHVFRDEMPMMERFAGWAYRTWPHRPMPFHVFLMILACWYSSATILPAFLLGARLGRGPIAGVVAVLFYVFTYSFIGSVVLGAYIRQDFVLPFLFLGTYFLLAAAEDGRWWQAPAAALLFAFSFVSWHLAQFYYLVLLAGLLALYLLSPAHRGRIAQALAVQTGVFLAAACFFLPLRSGGFPFSLAMLSSYALIGLHVALRGRSVATWKQALLLAGAVAALTAVATLATGGHYERYSHVYRLMIDKLRFLGHKPADPARLSFESRVMWTSSFLSPSPSVFAGWLGLAWLAGAAGVGLVVRRWLAERRLSAPSFLAVWLAAGFTVLYVLIVRMDVFAGFFVCALAGACAPRRPLSPRGAVVSLVLLGAVAFDYWKTGHFYLMGYQPLAEHVRPLLEAIRSNTGPDDVVVARFPLSPVICAYTERPVVIHSKFENRRVREKVEEIYTALFADEAALYAVCRKYGAAFVVYEPDMLLNRTGESVRYAADRLEIDERCAAMLMQFLPRGLQRFQLVAQSPSFRLYKVLEPGRRPVPVEPPELPVYDSRRFRREDLGLL